MKKIIEYTTHSFINAYYGSYGRMVVRNSINGVLVQHDKDLYDHENEKSDIGRKIVADICNQYRLGYETSLAYHYSSEEKKEFTVLLDGKISKAQELIADLQFAKTILSRKKVIFEKLTAEATNDN